MTFIIRGPYRNTYSVKKNDEKSKAEFFFVLVFFLYIINHMLL